jgi:hypothetical protein
MAPRGFFSWPLTPSGFWPPLSELVFSTVGNRVGFLVRVTCYS